MKLTKLFLVAVLALALCLSLTACPDTTPPAATTTTSELPYNPDPGPVDPGPNDPVDPTGPWKLQFSALTATTCTVSGYSGSASGPVEIPTTWTNNNITYTVKQISSYAFRNCTTLTSLTVPDTVEKIGQGALYGCSALTTVTLPFVGGSATADTYIGYLFGASSFSANAAYVPASLTTVVLSNACTSVAPFAFDSCTHVTAVTLGNHISSIGAYAFASCALTEVNLPDSVQTVGEGAFAHCPITSLNVPFLGENEEGDNAYLGFWFGADDYQKNGNAVPASLTSLTIREGCTTLGQGALYQCTGLLTPHLPSTLINIGKDAFTGTPYFAGKADGLVYVGPTESEILYTYKGTLSSPAVTVAAGTKAIASGAFDGMAITSVTIPDSVVQIGEGAFKDTALASITLSFIGENATATDNANFAFLFGNAAGIPASLTTVVLNQNCTKIPAAAFAGCTGIQTVAIGQGVVAVAKDAFFGCTSLSAISVDGANTAFCIDGSLLYNTAKTELFAVPCAVSGAVVIPDTVLAIGEKQFADCTGITSITLPASLVSIGKDAFAGASNLAALLSVPTGVSSVGTGAFDGTAWYAAQPNGMIVVGSSLYHVKGEMTEVTVPAGVVSITANAFTETNAVKITLPSSVVALNAGVFSGCTAVEELTLPFIGTSASSSSNAFLGYLFGATSTSNAARYLPAGLQKVVLLDTCTSVYTKAFAGCTALTTITFPDTVVYVAGDAMDATPYLANQPAGTLLYIAKIAYRFFAPEQSYGDAPALYDIVLRADTTAIADKAFAQTELHSIRIPDTTTYIGNSAFAECQTLEKVRMSSALVTLGESAFSKCSSLLKMYIPATLSRIEAGTFSNCTSMKALYIDLGISYIGTSAFGGCTALQLPGFVKYNGSLADWSAVTVEQSGNDMLSKNFQLKTKYDYTNPTFEGNEF